ncbi:RtcB family protein [Cupriavidus basilensis]|uniref:tRNA-splicing ligase RtcB n=1 Tax=Cupriavidus basilensis TaxID=68895 RepID=A0ABT6B189_9BURK|nr:RtcB family protein [Cupriavidus basilensis]MDF3838645.1 RtcB family protein [Cupriavidus basilensis]
MSSFPRLKKALQRQGIHVEHSEGVYHLRNEHAQASVLLPATLPLEAKAVRQLLDFAAVRSPDGHHGVCKACATPDFHPGGIAPVGSVVATDADFVIPAAIGTDINCGMRLITTGLTRAALEPLQEGLVRRLTRALLENGRDVPVHGAAFRALFDEGPAAFIDRVAPHGLWGQVDRSRLEAELAACVGLDAFGGSARHAPDAHVGNREIFRDPCLGTPGGGNHFVELQVVDAIFDRHAAYRIGLAPGDVVAMIHSGSRDVGFYVGRRWMDQARRAWPAGLKHPQSGLYGLSGGLAREYMVAMGTAARYAWANRVVLAELVRKELAELCGAAASRLVVDVPHNVVLREQDLNIHRKGATPAHHGELALIPGSMGDASFIVSGLGHADWLSSCSHGAGRSVRRQALRRVRGHQADNSWRCITLREERLIEESPEAYKPIGPVLQAQEEAGLIEAVARLKPWVTFKA